MRKKVQRITWILLAGFLVSLMTGCEPGSDQPNPPGTSVENVSAQRQGNTIVVSWNALGDGFEYEVFRQAAASSFVSISHPLTSANSWNDDEFSLDNGICYAVKSYRNGVSSELSAPSSPLTINSGTLTVQDVSASRYAYEGKIVLTWQSLDYYLRDAYIIYRYKSGSTDWEKKWTTRSTIWEDTSSLENPILENNLYWYKVVWQPANSASEYGTDNAPVSGCFGQAIDYHEPNDSLDLLAASGSSLLPEINPAVCYYQGEGNQVEWDTDYYKYSVTADAVFTGTVIVNIKLVDGNASAFLGAGDNRLGFEFYYRGIFYPAQRINQAHVSFVFSDFGPLAPGETTDLYFRIRPDIHTPVAFIGGAYWLSAGTELF